MPINTKSWKMGEYPMKKKVVTTIDEALAEIEMFNHKVSADVIRKHIAYLESKLVTQSEGQNA